MQIAEDEKRMQAPAQRAMNEHAITKTSRKAKSAAKKTSNAVSKGKNYIQKLLKKKRR